MEWYLACIGNRVWLPDVMRLLHQSSYFWERNASRLGQEASFSSKYSLGSGYVKTGVVTMAHFKVLKVSAASSFNINIFAASGLEIVCQRLSDLGVVLDESTIMYCHPRKTHNLV